MNNREVLQGHLFFHQMLGEYFYIKCGQRKDSDQSSNELYFLV